MAGTLTANFTRRFAGSTVIRGELHLPADAGRVTVVFGPSGCGKTTLLRCLAGLETPNDGFIRLGEEAWFDAQRGICLAPQQRGVGHLFQDYALFPHLTVAENIRFGLHDLPVVERKRRAEEIMGQFEVSALASRRPRELSGGEQQRVALARALARRPRILLLDEPLSALDTVAREALRGDLRRRLAGCGAPVLLVTHDRAEAIALGDDMVVMCGGQARQSGPVLEVFNHPADAEVARIVGVDTIQPGRVVSVADGLATVAVEAVRLLALAPEVPSENVFVSIRAEDVILLKGADTPGSARNRLPAVVRTITRAGQLMRVEVDCGFPLAALLTRNACEELALQSGDRVLALMKAPHIHLIPR